MVAYFLYRKAKGETVLEALNLIIKFIFWEKNHLDSEKNNIFLERNRIYPRMRQNQKISEKRKIERMKICNSVDSNFSDRFICNYVSINSFLRPILLFANHLPIQITNFVQYTKLITNSIPFA